MAMNQGQLRVGSALSADRRRPVRPQPLYWQASSGYMCRLTIRRRRGGNADGYGTSWAPFRRGRSPGGR